MNNSVYSISKKIILSLCLYFTLTVNTYSQETAKQTADSTKIAIPNEKKKDSYWNRLIHGNIDRTHERGFDISFVAAPSYTREASFGMGGMATGLYRLDRKDSIMPPSDITLTFNASINGFYALSARGNNYFKDKKSLLSYEVAFTTKPLDFWGISYDDCAVNPVIDYTRQQIKI